MLVELAADVDGRGLNRVEEELCQRGTGTKVSEAAEWTGERRGDAPATPGCSTSTRCGWNMHSGASNRSEPTLMTRPSGSCESEGGRVSTEGSDGTRDKGCEGRTS